MTLQAGWTTQLRRHWAASLAAALTVGAVGAIIAVAFPAASTATSSLLVSVDGPIDASDLYTTTQFAQNQAATLASAVPTELVLGQAARDLGRAQSLTVLQASVSATAEPGSAVVTVKATDPRPSRAMDLVKAIASRLVALSPDLAGGNGSKVRTRVLTDALSDPGARNRRLMQMIALTIVGAIGAAYLTARLRSRRTQPVHAQSWSGGSLPVIGTIPAPVDPQGNPLNVDHRSERARIGALRKLRLRLELHDLVRGEALFVTCLADRRGRTANTATLAALFAESGRQVTLIEADPDLPAIPTLLTLPESPGLWDLAAQRCTLAEALHRPIPRLAVVTAGRGDNPDLAGAFADGSVARTIEDVANQSDLALVAAPPLDSSAATLTLAAGGGRVIVVVTEAEAISLELVRRALTDLADVGAAVVGVVVQERGPGR